MDNPVHNQESPPPYINKPPEPRRQTTGTAAANHRNRGDRHSRPLSVPVAVPGHTPSLVTSRNRLTSRARQDRRRSAPSAGSTTLRARTPHRGSSAAGGGAVVPRKAAPTARIMRRGAGRSAGRRPVCAHPGPGPRDAHGGAQGRLRLLSREKGSAAPCGPLRAAGSGRPRGAASGRTFVQA